MWGMVKVLSLFEEALLVLVAQDPNEEQYPKAAAAIQNSIQYYWVICDGKKKSYHPDIGLFFQDCK